MKGYLKTIFFITLLLSFSNATLACDICGCVLSGNYFGLLPQYRKHFVGLRTQYSAFTVEHPPLFSNEQTTFSYDKAWNTEAWARIQISKLQVFASIPFQLNIRNEHNTYLQNYGIGDMKLILGTTLLKTPDTSKTTIKQTLFASAGLKLPTGISQNHETHHPNHIPGFQIGTGSWDFPFSINYTIRLKKLGCNLETQYLLRTANKQNYRYGNILNAAVRAFYWYYRPTFTLLPSVACLFEHYQTDLKNKILVTYSGGYATLMDAGLDFYKAAFGINLHFTFPLYQNIAKNHLTMQPRYMVTLLYLF